MTMVTYLQEIPIGGKVQRVQRVQKVQRVVDCPSGNEFYMPLRGRRYVLLFTPDTVILSEAKNLST